MNDPLGVVRTTEDLREILRARFAQLGVTLETVDAIAGLPARYTGKVLGMYPSKFFGAISFEALLGAAGLKLIAVEDVSALDLVRARLEPKRADTVACRRRVIIRLTPQHMKEIGRLGGLKRASNVAKRKALSEIRRRAVSVRYLAVAE